MATPEDSLTPAPTKKNEVLSELTKTGLSALLVYSAHYGTTKLYNVVCVPDGLLGYFFGLITTSSPWCRLSLEVMKLTENQYSTIILIVFSRLIMKALGI
jgi:hypothetical protein